MTDRHKPENIRDAAWLKNAPEWVGEVVAQLTENRQSNAAMLERLLDRENELQVRESALIKAIEDLKQFANSLYGPESAFAQLNAKLDGFNHALDEERRRSDGRYRELREAQDETDDHIKEMERSMESEFDVLRNRMKEVERVLGEMNQ